MKLVFKQQKEDLIELECSYDILITKIKKLEVEK